MKSTLPYTLLIVAGLNNSGEEHWQTYWQRKFPNAQKVNQKEWDKPLLTEWLQGLNQAIESTRGPIILVAHSLAVSLVLHWSGKFSNNRVKGALLVSASDVDSPAHTPTETRNFAPMPLHELPFPAILVASTNDPFVSMKRSEFFAEKWKIPLVSIGEKGHINTESRLEYWEEGQLILKSLIQKIG